MADGMADGLYDNEEQRVTTETLTLTDFLLARIAEDEEVARGAVAAESRRVTVATQQWPDASTALWRSTPDDPWVKIPPARVLAECEAKRRIVALHPEILTICQGCANESYPCRTLIALALPYADHPDYRDEWRP